MITSLRAPVPADSSLRRRVGLQKLPLLLRRFSTLSRALSSRSFRTSICFLHEASSFLSSDSVSKANRFSFTSSSLTASSSLLALVALPSASCSSCSSCSISSSIMVCSSLVRFLRLLSWFGGSWLARFSTFSLLCCSVSFSAAICSLRDAI